MTLTVAEVAAATNNRLAADDPDTARQLAVGLAAARRYCGWHVTPEQEDTVILDGRGGYSLRLPTMNLVELSGVFEDDVELDVNYLDVSQKGRVVKVVPYDDWHGFYGQRQWTERLGAIVVSMIHGYAEAPDWESVVLSYIVRTSLAAADGGRQRTAVGPFSYAAPVFGQGSAFTAEEKAVLDLYRLEPST